MISSLTYYYALVAKIKHQIDLEESRYATAVANKDPLASVYRDHANGLKTTLHYVEVWSPQTLQALSMGYTLIKPTTEHAV